MIRVKFTGDYDVEGVKFTGDSDGDCDGDCDVRCKV